MIWDMEDNMNTTKWQPKVASTCCACGRPLVDATSIEFGIGPVCRRKYQYEDAYPCSEAQMRPVVEALINAENTLEVVEFASRVECAILANDSRKAANLLVHFASTEALPLAIAATHGLRLLGYTALADVVQERLCTVRIEERPDGMLAVRTAWNPAFVAAVRNVPGRRWDGEAKVNLIPGAQRPALWRVLQATFAGAQGVGPKGPFVIAREVA